MSLPRQGATFRRGVGPKSWRESWLRLLPVCCPLPAGATRSGGGPVPACATHGSGRGDPGGSGDASTGAACLRPGRVPGRGRVPGYRRPGGNERVVVAGRQRPARSRGHPPALSTEGSGGLVTSTAAPIASGRSDDVANNLAKQAASGCPRTAARRSGIRYGRLPHRSRSV